MKIYKCMDCGNVYEMVYQKGGCTPTCCGNATKELIAGETDGALEKHVPVVSVENNQLNVIVGSVEHPMTEAHYITNIWAEFEDGTVERKGLIPTDQPKAIFDVSGKSGKVTIYEYCNLHGLWKTEINL